jgi:hypothetical protein
MEGGPRGACIFQIRGVASSSQIRGVASSGLHDQRGWSCEAQSGVGEECGGVGTIRIRGGQSVRKAFPRARPSRAIRRRNPWCNASCCGCRLLACTLGGRLLRRSFHAFLTTKAKRLSQARPLCRVIRRNNRIIALQAEGGAILARAQLMGRLQVPPESLEFLSAA